MWVNFREILEG